MSDRKKVLLILNTINDYRVETYNLINKAFDFTVAFNFEDQTKSKCEFTKIKLRSKKIGPFNVFGTGFWRECKKYDAVITSFDIHNFEFAFIPFIRRRYKLLTWGIGIRCSYTRPYNVNREHQLLDKVAYKILQAADANIFYMEKAKEFWRNTSLDMSKVFIAPNTTKISEVDEAKERNSILFVGTLYAGKGIDKLLSAFAEATNNNDNITLDIVGKGEEKKNLELRAKELNISDKVRFHGPIYEEDKLALFFAKALLCISPTQAGLSVPKSMGYGVPFVTRKDAITGGEIYHITPGINGILYNNDSELAGIIKNAIEHPENLKKMSEAAKKYYQQFARPEHQANGVIDAINFALSKNE